MSIFTFIIGVGLGFFLGFFALKKLFRKKMMEKWDEGLTQSMAFGMGHREWHPLEPLFSQTIQNISPSFCDIYEQAMIAEKGKLFHICGIGYGKSLEFLIKDYAKIEYPQKHNEIESLFLGNVIKQYINDESIKNSSELATWLRNDETHYIRKYKDKDVEHLKALIDLIIGLIENAEKKKLLAENVQKIKNTFP